MSARHVARALGAAVCHGDGNYSCHCPCGGHGQRHGDRHPSLSIRDGDHGLLVFCHGGCNPLDVFAELRRRGLLHGDDQPDLKPTSEHRDLAEYARTLWHEASPIEGTIAERYLREHRGISIALPPTLRFHHRVKVPRERLWFPALIAAVSGEAQRVIAVQVTWLNPGTADKASTYPPRRTFGKLADAAVRLGPAGHELGIAEGVETALSARELFDVPCWSVCGAERFAKVEIPHTVKRLHIFADGDWTGDEKAHAAARRLAGRFTVRVHVPSIEGDYNDVLRRRAA